MTGGNDVLTWLHIGDLHITDAEEQNYPDLKRIVGVMRGLPKAASTSQFCRATTRITAGPNNSGWCAMPSPSPNRNGRHW
jgi:hypothetical protein